MSTKGEQLLKFGSKLMKVGIDHVEFNPLNPREPIGKESVDDLKESIREVGVLVPIVVYKKRRKPAMYVLIEGERRLRATRELYKETRDKRFKTIPANIVDASPDQVDTLLTMFNLHTKRRPWGRPAEAEALGKLIATGQKRASNNAKLARLTGLSEIRVEEDRTYLAFPADLRKLAYEGEIPKYSLILLGRNLKAIRQSFPRVFEKYSWDTIAYSMINKVRSRTIRRVRDFNLLSSLAKTCIEYKNEDVFLGAFDELMRELAFSLLDMAARVDREMGYLVDETFIEHSENFLESLSANLQRHNNRIPKPVFEILQKISKNIETAEIA